MKNLHFILPGGGVRGAFQAGFLYQLFTNYSNTFNVSRIDGTSVGSINGFAVMNKNYQILSDTWLKVNNINDMFQNWSDSLFFGKIKSMYRGFYNNGIFSNSKINSMLTSNFKTNWDSYQDEWKDRYSCAVVNLSAGKTEYVSGTNPKIIDYITASASPWIISNPMTINDITYSDGALLENYPIKYYGTCCADYTVIIGYDQDHFHYNSQNNNNLFEYLANLIDITRFNSHNTYITRELIEKPDVISIANPMNISMVDFNKEAIHDGFMIGTDFANTFYKTYLEESDIH